MSQVPAPKFRQNYTDIPKGALRPSISFPPWELPSKFFGDSSDILCGSLRSSAGIHRNLWVSLGPQNSLESHRGFKFMPEKVHHYQKQFTLTGQSRKETVTPSETASIELVRPGSKL